MNKTKVASLGKFLLKIKKGWIALSPDNKYLLAKGASLNEVLEKSRKAGIDNPSVLKAVPFSNLMAG